MPPIWTGELAIMLTRLCREEWMELPDDLKRKEGKLCRWFAGEMTSDDRWRHISESQSYKDFLLRIDAARMSRVRDGTSSAVIQQRLDVLKANRPTRRKTKRHLLLNQYSFLIRKLHADGLTPDMMMRYLMRYHRIDVSPRYLKSILGDLGLK